MDWQFYYNLEGSEQVRANLVYTPYVSADNKTFCMSFNRDPAYHKNNDGWTEEILTERYNRELEFYVRAKKVVPTLDIIDIDPTERKIYLEWFGDDFYMQGLSNGYESVLPQWQEQWLSCVRNLWSANITKMSLHPNSWVSRGGELVPFNWFFSYDSADTLTIQDVAIQISAGRKDKLDQELSSVGMDYTTKYSVKKLQHITFNSFRSNYPKELIDTIIQELSWE